MPHRIREQRIRHRLNWFRKAQALGSVTDACVFFGISRKTCYKWRHRYTVSQGDRLSRAVGQAGIRPHTNLTADLVSDHLTLFDPDGRGVALLVKRLAATLNISALILTRQVMPSEVGLTDRIVRTGLGKSYTERPSCRPGIWDLERDVPPPPRIERSVHRRQQTTRADCRGRRRSGQSR